MRPVLLNYFRRRCVNTADAEDFTHDVLARTLARCGRKSDDEIGGYVFRAALNRLRDSKRRAAKRGVTLEWNDSACFAADDHTNPELLLAEEERARQLAVALHALPDRARQVVTLVKLEERAQAEVAAMFDISLSAVEKHIARALTHLRRSDLTKVVPTRPPGILSRAARQER